MKFKIIGLLSLLSTTVLFNSSVLSMEDNFDFGENVSIQLQEEINRLKENLLQIDKNINEAQSKRKKEREEVEKKKEKLILVKVAEKLLEDLNLLENLFIDQISKDHTLSKNPNKGIFPKNATSLPDNFLR